MLKPGSIPYYTTRWSNTPTQLLYTLYDTLSALPFSSTEPAILGQKLQFWHAELTRFFQKESPQHPLLQAWQQHPSLYTLPQTPFWDLIESLQWECEGGTFETLKDHQHFLHLKGGSLGRLVASLNNASSKATLAAQQLGSTLQALEHLQYLGRDLRRGFCFLPYGSHNLQLEDLRLTPTPSLPWQDYFKAQLHAWHTQTHNLCQQLSISDNLALKSLTTAYLLRWRTLLQLQKDGFPVYHCSYHLPPHRLFWWAWRNQRTHTLCKLF